MQPAEDAEDLQSKKRMAYQDVESKKGAYTATVSDHIDNEVLVGKATSALRFLDQSVFYVLSFPAARRYAVIGKHGLKKLTINQGDDGLVAPPTRNTEDDVCYEVMTVDEFKSTCGSIFDFGDEQFPNRPPGS